MLNNNDRPTFIEYFLHARLSAKQGRVTFVLVPNLRKGRPRPAEVTSPAPDVDPRVCTVKLLAYRNHLFYGLTKTQKLKLTCDRIRELSWNKMSLFKAQPLWTRSVSWDLAVQSLHFSGVIKKSRWRVLGTNRPFPCMILNSLELAVGLLHPMISSNPLSLCVPSVPQPLGSTTLDMLTDF